MYAVIAEAAHLSLLIDATISASNVPRVSEPMIIIESTRINGRPIPATLT